MFNSISTTRSSVGIAQFPSGVPSLAASSIAAPSPELITCTPNIQINSKTSWARIVAESPKRHNRMNLQFLEPVLVDGVVHVAPPTVVIEDGSKDWSNSLVGYFIGSKLPFSAVNTIARKIWSNDSLMDVLAHNRGFFFFHFSSDAGADAVLEKGPWLFAGR